MNLFMISVHMNSAADAVAMTGKLSLCQFLGDIRIE